jgi:hypothetical protein
VKADQLAVADGKVIDKEKGATSYADLASEEDAAKAFGKMCRECHGHEG